MNDSLRRGLEQLADRGTPRGATDVIDHARVVVRRRRVRTHRLVAVGAVALAVACIGAVAAIVDDDAGREVVTRPTVDPVEDPEVAMPPPDEGPIMLWLSETVVPRTGADVVAVLRNAGTESATFGVPTYLDRWDGADWQEELLFATCLDHWHCIAELEPADGWNDIGLGAPPGGSGATEWIRVEGLDAGWYRFRKVANEGDVATGTFEVVDRDVATVDLGDVTDNGLSISPVLVPATCEPVGPCGIRMDILLAPSSGGTSAGDMEAFEASLTAGARLERWSGTAWQPAGELDFALESIINTAKGPGQRWASLPAGLAPGSYRVVRTAPDGALVVGHVWVVDRRSADVTVTHQLRLDDRSVVAADLPATFELMEGPVVTPNPGGDGETTRWTFGSAIDHARLTVSVNKGPQAEAWFPTMKTVEGVTRQGAPVYIDEGMAGILPTPIGWSPEPGTVVWLGTNALSQEYLLAVSEGVRYTP